MFHYPPYYRLVYVYLKNHNEALLDQMAAVMAEGTTVIENAAKEPHVVDLANFLNSMGANIKGAGTDVIRIKGVSSCTGQSMALFPTRLRRVPLCLRRL